MWLAEELASLATWTRAARVTCAPLAANSERPRPGENAAGWPAVIGLPQLSFRILTRRLYAHGSC